MHLENTESDVLGPKLGSHAILKVLEYLGYLQENKTLYDMKFLMKNRTVL